MTLEEFDDAQECLQRTAEILNEKFVPNRIPMHALYSKVQIRLGEVTRLAGSLEDARQILETALKTQESTISSDHGNVLLCMSMYSKESLICPKKLTLVYMHII